MKKLTLSLIVASLCMLMSAAVVSADGYRWRGFNGVYEGTAAGSCLYSFVYFDPGFRVPNPPTTDPPTADAFGSTIVAKGTWTFKRNGTGNFEGQQFGISFPPFPGRSANVVDIKFDFKYTTQPNGKITITMEDFEGEYKYGGNDGLTYTVDQLEISGTVSQDLLHNSIKLISGGGDVQTYTLPPASPAGPNVTLYGICNVVYDLFRMPK